MPEHDIDTLISAYLEGELTEPQAEQLSAWLTASPDHARYVAELGLLERGLNRQLLAQESSDLFAELAALEDGAEVEQLVDITARVRSETSRQRRLARRQLAQAEKHIDQSLSIGPKALIWLGLAAAIALMVYLGWPEQPSIPAGTGIARLDKPSTDGVFARPIDTFQAVWEDGGQPDPAGMTAGRYRLVQGEARLQLADGTRIKVLGPAEFSLGLTGEMDLHAGELVVDASNSVAGFRVNTPSGAVRSPDARFGLEVVDALTTETEAINGAIQVAALSSDRGLGAFTEVSQAQAARLDLQTGQVDTIQSGGDRFSMDYVRVIDLVDIVAGGDGTGDRRNAGIDPQTGLWSDMPPRSADWTVLGDGRLHSVSRCPLVAGVVIPAVQGTPTELDPIGHRFDGLTVSNCSSYGPIWGGGYVPVPGAQPELDTLIDGVNYAAPSRGLVRMHANSGLCLDLAEMRRRHPGMTTTRFRTGVSNREATRRSPGEPLADLYASVDLWVFVDGRLRVTERDITTADGMIDIDLPLGSNDRYLTLVVTDGLNGTTFDWVLLCQPRIDLRPSDRE